MRSVWVALLACVSVVRAGPSVEMRDLDGRTQHPFQPSGIVQILFFIMTDCPISNFYAPDIQKLCGVYSTKGVTCTLVYEDTEVSTQAARQHMGEYRYKNISAVIDADRRAAKAAGATMTPETAVIDHSGKIRYRGRIDDFYAALGKPRRQATTHELQDAVEAVLAGKPVAVTEAKALGCYIVSPEVVKESK